MPDTTPARRDALHNTVIRCIVLRKPQVVVSDVARLRDKERVQGPRPVMNILKKMNEHE